MNLLGNLLYATATKPSLSIENRRNLLAKYVGEGKITTSQQMDLALAYLKSVAYEEKVNFEEFDKKIGVGVVVTEEQIRTHIKNLFHAKKAELDELRYNINFGSIPLFPCNNLF